MPLSTGEKLGPYEILAPIGAGGMGEVYRAHDTRLHRDIAIKVSAEKFSERFEREARLIGALNHPNICRLYDVGPDYLVMELIEGPTLAERIKQGAIPLEEALAIAKQIADALDAAHEKGIVHRDLKPGNVKIAPDGTVKVLDFGLAKMGGTPTAPVEDSPTISLAATQAGVILGTAAYMSPEQARGKPVDKRADIWAFGVVLYEMLTGKRLFSGETITDVLAAVIEREPDWDRVPAKARLLLRRCLVKDPKRRLRDIGDAMTLLEMTETQVSPVSAPRHWLAWSAGAVLFLSTAALAFIHFREKPPAAPALLRFQVLPPDKGAFGNYLALSPDGKRLAFTGSGEDGRVRLWVRNLDALESRPLVGTEDASSPFWSADSRFLAYADGGKLKKIDVLGGPPQIITEVPGLAGQGSWNSDGVIVFGQRARGPMWRVSATGGSPAQLTNLEAQQQGVQGFSSFLPDNRHFIYSRLSNTPANGIYVGSLDAKPEEQAARELLPLRSNAVFAPTAERGGGRLLFYQDGTLMAQPFDVKRLELTGEPVPVAEQIGLFAGAYGYFTASANGVLAYRGGDGSTQQLTWFDRHGKALGTVAAPGSFQRAAISPDGNTVAFDPIDSQTVSTDLWLHDLARGTDTRFTFGPPSNQFPVWSPDGSHIAFTSISSGGLFQRAVGGSPQDDPLDKAPRPKRADDWSRDGRYIIEETIDPNTKGDIWVLPTFGDRKPFPYLHTEFNETSARLSPDGQWLAYVSDETKRNEVYVQTFPAPGGKVQISTNGGNLPVWSKDGKELFFVAADRKMMAVEVKSGSKFEAGVPMPLFDARIGLFLGAIAASYDVSKDGRFLIPAQSERTASAPITVVVNWTAGLK